MGAARLSLDVGQSSVRRDGALPWPCHALLYLLLLLLLLPLPPSVRLRPPSSARPEPFCPLHRLPPTAAASLGFIPTRLGPVQGHGLRPASLAITITMPSSGLSSQAQLQHPGASRRSSMQAMPPPFIRQPYAIPRCKSLFFPIPHARTPLCSSLSFSPGANMLLSLEHKSDQCPLPRTYTHHHATSAPPPALLFPQSRLILSTVPATCRRQSLDLSCWARLHVSTALLSASLLPAAR